MTVTFESELLDHLDFDMECPGAIRDDKHEPCGNPISWRLIKTICSCPDPLLCDDCKNRAAAWYKYKADTNQKTRCATCRTHQPDGYIPLWERI